MSSVKKRSAIYGVIGLMLCVAVYLNWSYTQSPDEMVVADQAESEFLDSYANAGDGSEAADVSAISDAADTAANDYFAESRLSRQKARDEAITILKQTAESDSVSDEEKKAANEQITKLADNTVKESRIESLIKAKGYHECVTFISDSDVNVIVSKGEGEFDAEDASKIKDIVLSEVQVSAENIKIVETD